VLVSRRRVLLVGVGVDEHPVDVDDIKPRIGPAHPGRRTRPGPGLLNAGQRLGVHRAQRPPRRGHRRDLAEQIGLISQDPQVADRGRTISYATARSVSTRPRS
jgi:hypothetical protein